MSRLHLVRHGPTHAKSMVGWTDLPADLGDTAALDRLSAFLPETAVVVSSDLSRARATADAIQNGRPRLPDDPDLREIHFGNWELRKFDDIDGPEAQHLQAFWDEPGLVSAPQGESWHQMRARSDAAIDRLLTAHPGQDVIVVAHFGVILGQYERAAQIPTTEAFAQRIENLSVTRIACAGPLWQVETINHCP